MILAHLVWLQDEPGLALEPLASRLDAFARAELEQRQQPARRRHHLLSRALLTRALEGVGLNAGDLRYARADSGRLLLAAPAGWHISLSHGGDHVAVCVASAPCGVDIERPRPAGLLRLARRYFSAAEAARLTALAPADAERDFFRLWTLKEAGAKALDQGLAHNMARLAFDLEQEPPAALDAAVGLAVWQAQAGAAWLAAAVASHAPVAWQAHEVAPSALLA